MKHGAVNMKQLVTVINVSLVLLHFVLDPCHAALLRLPLKRAVGMEVVAHRGGANGRERRSIHSVTQTMEGISGEGYYIDVNVGTPPQQVSKRCGDSLCLPVRQQVSLVHAITTIQDLIYIYICLDVTLLITI